MSSCSQWPDHTVDMVVPSGGVVVGLTYKIGLMIVVASVTAAAGATIAFYRLGLHTLVKKNADTSAAGAIWYWDDTAKEFTTTASTNQKGGYSPLAVVAGTSIDLVLVPTI